MDFYKTTQTVRLSAGTILLLTVDQFKARQHLLAPKVDGLTVANEPVEFKAGEIIGLDQVPLSLKTSLEEVEFEDGEGEFEDWLLTNFPDDELDDEPGDIIKPSIEDHPDKGDSDSLDQQGSGNLPAGDDINQSNNSDLKDDGLSGDTSVETLTGQPSDDADQGESPDKGDASEPMPIADPIDETCTDGLGGGKAVVYDKPVETKSGKKAKA